MTPTLRYLILCCGIVIGSVPRAGADLPASQLLFHSGQEGFRRYRIPCLVATAKGTLLAICEGRKEGGGLKGDIDIVLKRSVDDGKTWKPLEVIADEGMHTLGNPCAVLDRRTDVVWLAFTRSHGLDTEEEIVAGKSREATRVFITSSADDGKTWAAPREISSTATQPAWTWYGTGPGIGIQLKGGRLIIPSYHAEKDSGIYRSHMVYSDDAGKTWQRGDAVGEHCSESQVVERADGSLVLNSRTIKGPALRTTALSKDGGKTWTASVHDKNLYDPNCQAAIYRLREPREKGPSSWIFVHPSGPGRRHLTARLSHDEGKTWPLAKKLRDGDSQYSCVALLSDGAIGCLYDCWVDGNYQLFFTRFRFE